MPGAPSVRLPYPSARAAARRSASPPSPRVKSFPGGAAPAQAFQRPATTRMAGGKIACNIDRQGIGEPFLDQAGRDIDGLGSGNDLGDQGICLTLVMPSPTLGIRDADLRLISRQASEKRRCYSRDDGASAASARAWRRERVENPPLGETHLRPVRCQQSKLVRTDPEHSPCKDLGPERTTRPSAPPHQRM
jgi:hypothetical protein